MAGWNTRRLGALESENPPNPRMVVLTAPADEVAEAVECYCSDTPEDEWAEVVVVVRRW